MRTPPESPSEDDVLQIVGTQWEPRAVRARYLPVGFGAHHWRIDDPDGAALFATLDLPAGFRTGELILSAYRGAVELAEEGFTGVVAPLRSRGGELVAATAGGWLSVTPWLDGRSPDEAEACAPSHVERVVALLQQLHACPPPRSAPVWSPRIAPGLAHRMGAELAAPWGAGPLGEEARQLLSGVGDELATWEARYHRLAAQARRQRDRWVPTHGEPHHANQFLDASGLRLVDWETLAVAPPERDLRDLPAEARAALIVDEEMIALFDLEWRLMEIEVYAHWFRAPHAGSEDDMIALEGLREEIAEGRADSA